MRRYHHLGIPTTESRPDEEYLPRFKMFTSGFEASEFGVEWMRFEPGCPLPKLVQRVPHVAFVVDDLEAELVGRELLIAPNQPSAGLTVAFVVENGAPIELMQFDDPAKERA